MGDAEGMAEQLDELEQEALHECQRNGEHDICFGCSDAPTYHDAASLIRSLAKERDALVAERQGASLLMGILIERLGDSVEIKEAEIVQFDGTVARTNHFDGNVTLALHPNTEAPKKPRKERASDVDTV